MIDKILYWLVTVPARNLASMLGGAAVLLLIGVVALAQSAGARAPQDGPAATTPRATPVARATGVTRVTPGASTPAARDTEAPGTPAAQGTQPAATPSLPSTVTLNEWTISLTRVELRQCVSYRSAGGRVRVEKQPHYFFWVDARNDAAGARSLRRTIVWSIHTDDDHIYYARPEQDQETGETGEWVAAEGRDYLSADVAPGAETHPVLAFRTFSYKPIKLAISTVEAQPQVVEFDLSGLEPAARADDVGCD